MVIDPFGKIFKLSKEWGLKYKTIAFTGLKKIKQMIIFYGIRLLDKGEPENLFVSYQR